MSQNRGRQRGHGDRDGSGDFFHRRRHGGRAGAIAQQLALFHINADDVMVIALNRYIGQVQKNILHILVIRINIEREGRAFHDSRFAAIGHDFERLQVSLFGRQGVRTRSQAQADILQRHGAIVNAHFIYFAHESRVSPGAAADQVVDRPAHIHRSRINGVLDQ